VTARIAIEVAEEAPPAADHLPDKDSYTMYVSLYGDELSVYQRRRGSLEGYFGAYTSLALLMIVRFPFDLSFICHRELAQNH